jgi:hypothetical protein
MNATNTAEQRVTSSPGEIVILHASSKVDPVDPRLSSGRAGPFPVTRRNDVPTYFEDNLLALRHWRPPGSFAIT